MTTIVWGGAGTAGGVAIDLEALGIAVRAGRAFLAQILRAFLLRVGGKRILGMFAAAITPELISKLILLGMTIWLIWEIIDALTTYYSVQKAIDDYVEELVIELAEGAPLPPNPPTPQQLLDCVRRCVEQAVRLAGQFSLDGSTGLPASIRVYLQTCIRGCFGLR